LVLGDTDLTPYDMGTFGSRTTPTMAPQLRRVAAAARDLLVDTAAKEWNISPDNLIAANAKVTDPGTGRSTSYAEVARGKTLARNIPDEDPITPASKWTIAGKAIPKVDGRAFVTGRYQYTSDLRPTGMMYGKEELASLDSLTRKLVTAAEDGPHNQIESNTAIEDVQSVEVASEQCESL
jgi:CO/xanthine dehydrogenase Mo-binding subunit